MERLYKFNENGGIVRAQEVEEKETKQKNYVIDVKVADGIRELAKQNKVNESRMIEEMYYTFMELLERGKEEPKKSNKRSSKKDDKAEAKEEK